jgi:recombinational DNA repair ATPase RecF
LNIGLPRLICNFEQITKCFLIKIDMILRLHNLRCFDNLQVRLPDHNFILLDQNGSGKTTILSSLYSLLSGKPFGISKFGHYLKSEAEYFGISCDNPDLFLTGKVGSSGRVTTKWSKDFDYQKYISNHIKKERNVYKFLTYQPNDNLWLFQTRSFKLLQLDAIIDQSFESIVELSNKLDKLNKHKLQLLKHSLDGGSFDYSSLNFLSDEIIKISLKIWTIRIRFFLLWQSELPKFFLLIQNSLKNWKFQIQITNVRGQKKLMSLPNLSYTKLGSQKFRLYIFASKRNSSSKSFVDRFS